MTQTEKLFHLLRDQKPYRTDKILSQVYGSEHLGIARIAARIYDMKQQYNVEVDCWKDKKTKTLFWYQITKMPKRWIFKK